MTAEREIERKRRGHFRPQGALFQHRVPQVPTCHRILVLLYRLQAP